MNYIKEVVKLLGLELGEKFELEEICGTFYFKEDNLYQSSSDGDSVACHSIVVRIINGAFTIKKIPFKPEYRNTYYSVYYNTCDEIWFVYSTCWYNSISDLSNYALGNCYKTEEEAKQNFKKIKNKLEKYMVEED